MSDEEKEKLTVKKLLRELEIHAVKSNNSYDSLLDGWRDSNPQLHAEAKADQSDLSDAIDVLIAEREFAKAEAKLFKAQLKLARKALHVVSLEGPTASLISENIKYLDELKKKKQGA